MWPQPPLRRAGEPFLARRERADRIDEPPARAQRAKACARRIDEDPVELALYRRVLRVADAYVDDLGPHPRAGLAQRLGAPLVALDGDDLAVVVHQRGQVRRLAARRGAEVED